MYARDRSIRVSFLGGDVSLFCDIHLLVYHLTLLYIRYIVVVQENYIQKI